MKASNAFCAIQIELFPFRYPITSATEYFGGIEINICTWSGSRCPSSILHSLRRASSWNTVPNCRRICPNNAFLRYFGVNATWYLHSHVACSADYDLVTLQQFSFWHFEALDGFSTGERPDARAAI
jgi:hypothetical protein